MIYDLRHSNVNIVYLVQVFLFENNCTIFIALTILMSASEQCTFLYRNPHTLTVYIRKKWLHKRMFEPKLYVPSTPKHWTYTVAHTIDCVCSKLLNHGLFISLFKRIPCHIHWIVYVLAYWNFIFKF